MTKGILDIEFILSVFVFVSTVSFVVVMVVIGNIPALHQFSVSEDIKSRSYQISEKLLLTQGNPTNWDENNVNSLGLSSGNMHILSMGKINSMGSLCNNNYNRVKELLGLGYGNDVKINIAYVDGSQIISCGYGIESKRLEFGIERFGVVNNMPVRLSVFVS